MEAAHKETLLGIHRESIHLLRAINRFKETVAQILEKEQLPVAAHQVRLLANLPTEEVRKHKHLAHNFLRKRLLIVENTYILSLACMQYKHLYHQ